MLKSHYRPTKSEVLGLVTYAGDTYSVPGLGRFHTPWSNWIHTSQLLTLYSWALKSQLLSLSAATAEAHVPKPVPQEKPQQGEARSLQWRVAPDSHN